MTSPAKWPCRKPGLVVRDLSPENHHTQEMQDDPCRVMPGIDPRHQIQGGRTETTEKPRHCWVRHKRNPCVWTYGFQLGSKPPPSLDGHSERRVSNLSKCHQHQLYTRWSQSSSTCARNMAMCSQTSLGRRRFRVYTSARMLDVQAGPHQEAGDASDHFAEMQIQCVASEKKIVLRHALAESSIVQ